jgi:hypothetical protein
VFFFISNIKEKSYDKTRIAGPYVPEIIGGQFFFFKFGSKKIVIKQMYSQIQ